jgi:hypothetical protein
LQRGALQRDELPEPAARATPPPSEGAGATADAAAGEHQIANGEEVDASSSSQVRPVTPEDEEDVHASRLSLPAPPPLEKGSIKKAKRGSAVSFSSRLGGERPREAEVEGAGEEEEGEEEEEVDFAQLVNAELFAPSLPSGVLHPEGQLRTSWDMTMLSLLLRAPRTAVLQSAVWHERAALLAQVHPRLRADLDLLRV